MPAPRYSKPLPGPLAALRASRLRRAFRTDPRVRTDTWSIDGFSVLMDPTFPSPAPRFGWSPQSMLGRGLDVRPGERLCDLGCAGGLVSLHAARRGARVVAVDWEPVALICVGRGFRLAGMGEAEVVEGSSIRSVGDQPFDVVAWSVPFVAGEPRSSVDRRILRGAQEETKRELRDIRALLRRGGRLTFVYPDRDAAGWLHAALEDAGFRYSATQYERFDVIGPVRLYRAWIPRSEDAPGEISSGEPLAGAAWVLRDR